MNYLVFAKYTKITTKEPSTGSGRGSEIINASLDTESEMPGAHLGGSVQSCKYGLGACQGGLSCESPQRCLGVYLTECDEMAKEGFIQLRRGR